ncbi:MAG: hypothetical protein WCL14_06765 [Bacteroidota bacterium]
MFDKKVQEEVYARLDKSNADSLPRWGKMNVAHWGRQTYSLVHYHQIQFDI